ncbi:hypothetical protein QTV43_000086 [Vibrio vulnificus]|nr:hypothetical protein [Vibrio vulnificus]
MITDRLTNYIAEQGIDLTNKTATPINAVVDFVILDLPFSLIIKEQADGSLHFMTKSPLLMSTGVWSLQGCPFLNKVDFRSGGEFGRGYSDYEEVETVSKYHITKAVFALNIMVAVLIEELLDDKELQENILSRCLTHKKVTDEQTRIANEDRKTKIEKLKADFDTKYLPLTKKAVADKLQEAKQQSIGHYNEVKAKFSIIVNEEYKIKDVEVSFRNGAPKLGSLTTLKEIKHYLLTAVEPK